MSEEVPMAPATIYQLQPIPPVAVPLTPSALFVIKIYFYSNYA
jgi:hypothetical protein